MIHRFIFIALLIALFAAALFVGACAGSPVAPTYTCYTQPRYYFQLDDLGQEYAGHYEVDVYAQPEPCPATPIK